MSDLYPTRRIEHFTRLNVFRHVHDAEVLIDTARGFSESILGQEITGQVPISGEENYIDVGYPYCSVKDASDIQLDMYSIRDVPESRPESRFSNVKKHLLKGYEVPKRTNTISALGPRPPLIDVLDDIQYLQHGVTSEDLEVEIVGLGVRFDSDIQNGKYELTFLPNIASTTGKMLLDQARYIQSRVPIESRRVGYPISHGALEIPFASVRTVPLDRLSRENRFHANLRKILPVTVGLSGIKIE